MRSFDLSRVEDARRLLYGFFSPTRLVSAPYLSRRSSCEVYLKLESELPTGSFKPRGALFALHSKLQERTFQKVVTASTGNHGAAVAYAARQLRIQATIILPTHSNPVKRAKIADLGANIVESGTDLTEALVAAREYAERHGAYFLDDAVDSNIPVGTATIAREIFEQLPETQAIYVPVGDSALIRGIAAVAKSSFRNTRIVGVQAERAPSYYYSWRAGSLQTSGLCDTIADGLATRRPVLKNVEAIRGIVDEMRLVAEEEMLNAIRCLFLEEQILSEPAGAASTAALLQDNNARTTENAVLIVSGCNISAETRHRAMASSSARDTRLRV